MELTRRSFLRGVLTVAAVTALPAIPLADVPVIYGDGIRDDAPGLQAMFNGEPFRIDGEAIVATSSTIRGGRFALSKTVFIDRDGGSLIIDGAEFSALPGYRGTEMLVLKRVRCASICNCTFRLPALNFNREIGLTFLSHQEREYA